MNQNIQHIPSRDNRPAASAGETRPLVGLTLEELRKVAAECGLPRFAATQIAKWLYDKRVESIDQMTDISKAGRAGWPNAATPLAARLLFPRPVAPTAR